MNDLERRDLGVPFEEDRYAGRASVGDGQKLPHRIDYWADVRIDDVRSVIGVPRDVELNDSIERHRVEVSAARSVRDTPPKSSDCGSAGEKITPHFVATTQGTA
jgi:phage protein D